MIIDEKVIKHLEDLSKLNLSESERKELMEDLNKILNYVGNIKDMDLGKSEGMYTPIDSYTELRKDEVLPSESDKNIIKNNFPEISENGVKVPAIK
jgi:aspartyl-tRNA(Asn)/glutamyl-tRNA(Gln) amidotransferase subunit C